MEKSLKEVNDLEKTILSLQKNLSEIEKKLEQIDTNCETAIKKCVKSEGGYNSECMTQIQSLHKEEEENEKLWISTRKEIEANEQLLRLKWLDVIKKKWQAKKDQKSTISIKAESESSLNLGDTDFASMVLGRTSRNFSSSPSIMSGSSGQSNNNLNSIFGDWKILEQDIVCHHKQELGSGYFAKVCKGTAYGVEVAIKIIKEHKVKEIKIENLQSEAKSLKNMIVQPHLVVFLGISTENGIKIVVELLKNGSLDDVITATDENDKPKYKLSFARKIKIMKEITEGLSWLHQRDAPMLHLRIKPSNILLTRDWKAKVGDYGFGLPRLEGKSRFDSGYAHFQAPEILDDKGPTAQCDVYSYGILLWYIITEKMPYSNIKDFKELKDHVMAANRPPMPSNTPPSLKSLIEKCWDQDPKKRPLFSDILKEDKWDQIVIEAIGSGEELAMKIWKESSAQATSNKIPWNIFLSAFRKGLEIDPKEYPDDDVKFQCLKAALDVDKADTQGNKGFVSLANYERFLIWFGPLRSGNTEGPSFLNEIVNLLKQDYFHGEINGIQAEQRLKAAAGGDGKKDGKKLTPGFIIRFSANEKAYTLTTLERVGSNDDPKGNVKYQILHKRIFKAGGNNKAEEKNIVDWVREWQLKSKLKPCSYNREYASLFQKKSNIPDIGYLTDGTALLNAKDFSSFSGSEEFSSSLSLSTSSSSRFKTVN